MRWGQSRIDGCDGGQRHPVKIRRPTAPDYRARGLPGRHHRPAWEAPGPESGRSMRTSPSSADKMPQDREARTLDGDREGGSRPMPTTSERRAELGWQKDTQAQGRRQCEKCRSSGAGRAEGQGAGAAAACCGTRSSASTLAARAQSSRAGQNGLSPAAPGRARDDPRRPAFSAIGAEPPRQRGCFPAADGNWNSFSAAVAGSSSTAMAGPSST